MWCHIGMGKKLVKTLINHMESMGVIVGLGGLRVTCSPQDPRFADWNPAKVNGFFQNVKILSTSSSGGTLKLGVPSLRFQAR